MPSCQAPRDSFRWLIEMVRCPKTHSSNWIGCAKLITIFAAAAVASCDVRPPDTNSVAHSRSDSQSHHQRGRALPTPIVEAGERFACTPISVWDGDGPIWCAEGPRIRLAGIAAREIDEGCRQNQPCPDRSGHEARDHLVELLGGPKGETSDGHIRIDAAPLNCISRGHAVGSRTGAWCQTAAGIDLSCAMVQSGYALRWAQYDREQALCRPH
jgi:endonuclease YncB( thermonuclease family)